MGFCFPTLYLFPKRFVPIIPLTCHQRPDFMELKFSMSYKVYQPEVGLQLTQKCWSGVDLLMHPWAQLVLEVVQQLQRMFQPDFRLIKKRIEDLIAREYLERDKDNPNTFKYLA